MAKETLRLELSPKSVIYTLLILLGAYLILQLIDIFILLFIAVLFTTAVSPLVSKIQAWHIPRGFAIAIVYITFFGIVIATVAAIVPQLIIQLINLISQISFPSALLDHVKSYNVNLQDLQVIANQLNSVPKILSWIFSAFSSIVIFFTLIVISYYLILEREKLPRYLSWMFHNHVKEAKAEKFVQDLETQIGGWVRGEFLLMTIVGLMTYIGLKLLGISYTLPLALTAGLLELLPNIGPTISAIPAIAVAFFTVSPAMALAVLALYVLVQQLENNLIVPQVMRHAVGLNPIITITLLLSGFRLGGVGGAVLAIPVFLVIKVVAVQIYKLKEIPDSSAS